jgi:hypothetical protein
MAGCDGPYLSPFYIVLRGFGIKVTALKPLSSLSVDLFTRTILRVGTEQYQDGDPSSYCSLQKDIQELANCKPLPSRLARQKHCPRSKDQHQQGETSGQSSKIHEKVNFDADLRIFT